jgi:hypothetical protein
VTGEIMNATFFGNQGGPAISGSSTVLNSILWQNEENLPTGAGEPDVLVSFVEGGYSGGASQDVIVTDPLLKGELFAAMTGSISSELKSSLLGHDASVSQGSLDGLFAEIQTGALAGFYFIVKNPLGSLEILGVWDAALESQTVAVFDLHLTASSPAIDRARGTTETYSVSAADVEGKPRRDDPSVIDSGTGDPTYVDVGAYER